MNHNTLSKIRNILLFTASLSAVAMASAPADESPCPNCGCSHGVQVVEVSRTVCKMVTKQEPIKKTVYEKKEVPFCEHCVAPIGHHHVCPQCKACGKTRTVLVKKSIECGKKTVHECVPEVITEQVLVPCKECGFCPRHGNLLHKQLLHSANANQTVPSVNVSAVENRFQETTSIGSSTVEVAAEPKLRELSPLAR